MTLALIRTKITDFFFVAGVFGGWNSSKAKVEMASRYFRRFLQKMTRFFEVAGTSNGKTYPPENYHIS